MKKIFALGLCATFAVAAHATSFTFTPNPSDLSDLDHTHSYAWGMSNATLKAQLKTGGYKITGVTIKITDLYNWDKNDTNNMLFINLIDNPVLGLSTPVDDAADQGVNQGIVSNYFGGNVPGNNGNYYSRTSTLLTTYHDADGPTTHDTYSFDLSIVQMTLLGNYITAATATGDGDFGIGFDPDCHYYNTGISVTITTSVPDGSMTLMLLGLALSAMAFARRFIRS
ncbi:MAG: putative exosortase interaction protein [Verrucomicrobia bacterium]|nr:putative exosortase interaction protein [Verrucomicrobiota bacterium]